jgi:hypothetical protein
MTYWKILTALCLLAATASGQALPPGYDAKINKLLTAYRVLSPDEINVSCLDAAVPQHPRLILFCDALQEVLDPNLNARPFAIYVLSKQNGLFNFSQLSSFLSTVADTRIDQHNGATTADSGSTNAVVRAGISSVLGVALESGAMTQSVSGSTLTLQGNALSLSRFLQGQDVFQYCADGTTVCQGSFASFLNKFSGSAALNLSSPSTQTATGTVAQTTSVAAEALIQQSASHLTSFSVRFQAYNPLDLRSDLYVKAWKAAFADKALLDLAAALNKQLDTSFAFREKIPVAAYRQWLLDAETEVRKALAANPTTAAASVAVGLQLDKLGIEARKNGLTTDSLRQFLVASNVYLVARDLALQKAREQTANGINLEYRYSRPVNQPRISTARLAYTLRPGVAKPSANQLAGPQIRNDTAITFNVAADMYNNPPPGTGALRDLSAGLQLDHHFGSTVATLAAYYQYQREKAALQFGPGNLAPYTNIVLPGPSATLLVPKGNIILTQGKVTFSLKNGVKLPVGVTWSNRTELINANEVRGHVGFDFDWSSLLLAAKAKE